MLRFLYEGRLGEVLAPPSSTEETSFLCAAGGNCDAMKRLLDSGLDPGTTNAAGNSLMHVAAAAGHLDLCQLLLDWGVAVDTWGRHATTPLLLATRRGHDDVAMLLLAYGANPALPAADGDSPLSAACARGNAALVQKMIAKGVPLSLPSPVDGSTPLHAAARSGSVDVVRLLLDAGADAAARADDDLSALDVAADGECRDLLQAARLERVAWLPRSSPTSSNGAAALAAPGVGGSAAAQGADEGEDEGDEDVLSRVLLAVADGGSEDEGRVGRWAAGGKEAEEKAQAQATSPAPADDRRRGHHRRRRRRRHQPVEIAPPETAAPANSPPSPSPDLPSRLLADAAAGRDPAATSPHGFEAVSSDALYAGAGSEGERPPPRPRFEDMLAGGVRPGPARPARSAGPSPDRGGSRASGKRLAVASAQDASPAVQPSVKSGGGGGVEAAPSPPPPSPVLEGAGGSGGGSSPAAAASPGERREGEGEGAGEEESEEAVASRVWREHELSVRQAQWHSELQRSSGMRRPPPGVRAAAAMGVALGSLTQSMVAAGKKHWAPPETDAAVRQAPQRDAVIALPQAAAETVPENGEEGGASQGSVGEEMNSSSATASAAPAADVNEPRSGWFAILNDSLRGAVAEVRDTLAAEDEGLVAEEDTS